MGTKRKQLEEIYGKVDETLKALNIPLHENPNATVKPIEIKPRELRPPAPKPSRNPATREVRLSRDDVVKLVDFIERYVHQFEVSPRPYTKLEEEDLRDLLVGMMNINYLGNATAETFSKLGKTDISLRLDTGHILVCECKFWSGTAGYSKALGQLFRYLTWRQNYGVLITFVRQQNMSRAVAAAKKAMTEHPTATAGSLYEHSATRFSTRHLHPQDEDKAVEIHHVLIDLSS